MFFNECEKFAITLNFEFVTFPPKHTVLKLSVYIRSG